MHTSTTQEEDAAVASIMRHVLFKHHQQPDVPIPRAELVSVIKPIIPSRKSTSIILLLAQARFASVFGMHLEEIQKKTKAAAGSAPSSAQSSMACTYGYLCTTVCLQYTVSSRQYNFCAALVAANRAAAGGDAAPPRRATTRVAAHSASSDPAQYRQNAPWYVCIKQEKCRELHIIIVIMRSDDLLQHLEHLGVSVGQRHEELGNVQEVLAAMVKQRQLYEGKSAGPDGVDVRFYEWGEQAEAHVDKEALGGWVHDLCGITPRETIPVKDET